MPRLVTPACVVGGGGACSVRGLRNAISVPVPFLCLCLSLRLLGLALDPLACSLAFSLVLAHRHGTSPPFCVAFFGLYQYMLL